MSRPRTPLGTAGGITLVGQVQVAGRWVTAPAGTKPTRWRARVKFRDLDGQLRDVERFDRTKAKAETKLRIALSERKAPTKGQELRADMTLVDAFEVWISQVLRPDSGLAQNTRDTYAAARHRYLDGSSIAGLSLREVNRVPVLRPYLQGIADKHGTSAAKTARSVISGVFRLAVTDGVLDANAMRDVPPAKASVPKVTERDTGRALSREERDHLLSVADKSDVWRDHLDVSDFLWFLAGTGVRIGEALGQRWEDIDLDADGTGTVFVRGTKTERSQRLLSLPPWLQERLRLRAETRGTVGLLFPSPWTGEYDKPRDRRNVIRLVREMFDEAGFPWATSHTLRRTVASLIDEAGLPIALAANQLGHADASMTARLYLGRKGGTAAAAKVL